MLLYGRFQEITGFSFNFRGVPIMKKHILCVVEIFGYVTVTVFCPCCGKIYKVGNIKSEEWKRWIEGDYAQNAFSNLSSIDREKLISGLCEDCQKQVFGE